MCLNEDVQKPAPVLTTEQRSVSAVSGIQTLHQPFLSYRFTRSLNTQTRHIAAQRCDSSLGYLCRHRKG